MKEPTLEEVTGILDRLQEQIEHTPYENEAALLSGSYHLHLCTLRRLDPPTANYYGRWLKDYYRTQRALQRPTGTQR